MEIIINWLEIILSLHNMSIKENALDYRQCSNKFANKPKQDQHGLIFIPSRVLVQ